MGTDKELRDEAASSKVTPPPLALNSNWVVYSRAAEDSWMEHIFQSAPSSARNRNLVPWNSHEPQQWRACLGPYEFRLPRREVQSISRSPKEGPRIFTKWPAGAPARRVVINVTNATQLRQTQLHRYWHSIQAPQCQVSVGSFSLRSLQPHPLLRNDETTKSTTSWNFNTQFVIPYQGESFFRVAVFDGSGTAELGAAEIDFPAGDVGNEQFVAATMPLFLGPVSLQGHHGRAAGHLYIVLALFPDPIETTIVQHFWHPVVSLGSAPLLPPSLALDNATTTAAAAAEAIGNTSSTHCYNRSSSSSDTSCATVVDCCPNPVATQSGTRCCTAVGGLATTGSSCHSLDCRCCCGARTQTSCAGLSLPHGMLGCRRVRCAGSAIDGTPAHPPVDSSEARDCRAATRCCGGCRATDGTHAPSSQQCSSRSAGSKQRLHCAATALPAPVRDDVNQRVRGGPCAGGELHLHFESTGRVLRVPVATRVSATGSSTMPADYSNGSSCLARAQSAYLDDSTTKPNDNSRNPCAARAESQLANSPHKANAHSAPRVVLQSSQQATSDYSLESRQTCSPSTTQSNASVYRSQPRSHNHSSSMEQGRAVPEVALPIGKGLEMIPRAGNTVEPSDPFLADGPPPASPPSWFHPTRKLQGFERKDSAVANGVQSHAGSGSVGKPSDAPKGRTGGGSGTTPGGKKNERQSKADQLSVRSGTSSEAPSSRCGVSRRDMQNTNMKLVEFHKAFPLEAKKMQVFY